MLTQTFDSYDFHYVYQRQVIGVSLALPIVCAIATALRFFVRVRKRHPLQWDDWFIVLALVCLIGLGVDMTVGGFGGVFGKPMPHAATKDPEVIFEQLSPGQALIGKLQYIFWILLTLCYGFTKLSVIFFYRRLFVIRRTLFDYITWAAIVISALWTVSFFFTVVFVCGRHPEYVWGTLRQIETCPINLVYLEGYMISDFLTDCLIYFMPFPLLWRLQMPIWRKLAVSLVLIIGALSLATNVARLVYQVLITKYGHTSQVDQYLALTLILFWSLVEAGAAIIAINLPVLQPLLGDLKISKHVESPWTKMSRTLVKSSPTRETTTVRTNNQDAFVTVRNMSKDSADSQTISMSTTKVKSLSERV